MRYFMVSEGFVVCGGGKGADNCHSEAVLEASVVEIGMNGYRFFRIQFGARVAMVVHTEVQGGGTKPDIKGRTKIALNHVDGIFGLAGMVSVDGVRQTSSGATEGCGRCENWAGFTAASVASVVTWRKRRGGGVGGVSVDQNVLQVARSAEDHFGRGGVEIFSDR